MAQGSDRIAGLLGASASLWWCFYQGDTALNNWNLQAAFFYIIHAQVALLFVSRLKSIVKGSQESAWLICGASLVGVYLIDFSVQPSGILSTLGESLTLAGCMFSILAIASLGKGFGVLPAFRRLAFRGPYRIIRHPVYAGYLLMDFGILLSYPRIENLIIIACNAGMLIARIQMEERICASVKEYMSYMTQVRFRLIPGVY